MSRSGWLLTSAICQPIAVIFVTSILGRVRLHDGHSTRHSTQCIPEPPRTSLPTSPNSQHLGDNSASNSAENCATIASGEQTMNMVGHQQINGIGADQRWRVGS